MGRDTTVHTMIISGNQRNWFNNREKHSCHRKTNSREQKQRTGTRVLFKAGMQQQTSSSRRQQRSEKTQSWEVAMFQQWEAAMQQSHWKATMGRVRRKMIGGLLPCNCKRNRILLWKNCRPSLLLLRRHTLKFQTTAPQKILSTQRLKPTSTSL